MSGLHGDDGTVAVDGFYDGVREPSDHERLQLAALDFDEEVYRLQIGVPALHGEQGYGTLERLWLRPTLEVNGLQGGYQGAGRRRRSRPAATPRSPAASCRARNPSGCIAC